MNDTKSVYTIKTQEYLQAFVVGQYSLNKKKQKTNLRLNSKSTEWTSVQLHRNVYILKNLLMKGLVARLPLLDTFFSFMAVKRSREEEKHSIETTDSRQETQFRFPTPKTTRGGGGV